MKKFTLLGLVLCFVFSSFGQDYALWEEGYKDGYKKGYCHNKGISCIPPSITPFSPMPSLDNTEYWYKNNPYTAGYNTGFIDGLSFDNNSKSESYNKETYVPKINQFTPDYEFYHNAIRKSVRENRNNEIRLSSEQEELVKRLYDDNNITIRGAYLELVNQKWSRNHKNHNVPDKFIDGFYEKQANIINSIKEIENDLNLLIEQQSIDILLNSIDDINKYFNDFNENKFTISDNP